MLISFIQKHLVFTLRTITINCRCASTVLTAWAALHRRTTTARATARAVEALAQQGRARRMVRQWLLAAARQVMRGNRLRTGGWFGGKACVKLIMWKIVSRWYLTEGNYDSVTFGVSWTC